MSKFKTKGEYSFYSQLFVMVLLFLLIPIFAFSQKRVTGTVSDMNGEPLIGVNVVVKGTTTGTVTDIDGDYELQVPGNDAVLEFSYIGYTSVEVLVGNQTVINQTLTEDVQLIDEVVVVGYGVQRKETATGSVTSVKGDDLIKSPVTNLSNAIAGRMPGVITLQRSGEPGYDGATIRIRGLKHVREQRPAYSYRWYRGKGRGLGTFGPE